METIILIVSHVILVTRISAEVVVRSSVDNYSLDDDTYSYFHLQSSAGHLHESSCPRGCLCGTGTSQPPLPVKGYFPAASCVSRKLTTLPSGFPSDIRILTARGNALSTVSLPRPLPSELAELDLSYNVIVDVDFTAALPESNNFSRSVLRHLNLNHNLIERLTNVSFLSSSSPGGEPVLARVEVLLLAHNRIRSFGFGCFEPLVALQWLSLSGNYLSSLAADVFAVLGSLTDLELDHNWLSKIGVDSGDNRTEESTVELSSAMKSLRSLNLASNRIERITGNAFDHVGSTLEQLDIGFNLLRSVPSNALRSASFSRLRRLVLDGNPITALTTRGLEQFGVMELSVSRMPLITALTTRGLEQFGVMELSISRMPLMIAVYRHALFDLRHLNDIRMHDNRRLVYVDPDFVGWTQSDDVVESNYTSSGGIKYLRLHRNWLSAFESPLAPDRLPGLELLTLYGNPISCGCHSDWIRKEIRRIDKSPLKLNNADESSQPRPCNELSNKLSLNDSTTVSGNSSSSILPITSSFNATSAATVPTSQQTSQPTSQPIPLVTCLPAVVMSRKFVYATIGDDVELDCHVVHSSPTTSGSFVRWMLPGGKTTNNSFPNSSGSLRIVAVGLHDAGKYTCTAPYSTLTSTSSTSVQLVVYSLDTHVTIVAVGSDYVSVTWVGIESTIASGLARYVIVYRARRATSTNGRSRDENLTSMRNNEYYVDDVIAERGFYDNDFAAETSTIAWRQMTSKSFLAASRTWCVVDASDDECLFAGVEERSAESDDDGGRGYRKAIDVRPYMRGHWISGLVSGTRYEICIGIYHEDEARAIVAGDRSSATVIEVINCSAIVTHSADDETSSTNHRHRKDHLYDLDESDRVVVLVVGGVLFVVCIGPAAVGLLGLVVRRRQRRKEYAEPRQHRAGRVRHRDITSYARQLVGSEPEPDFRVDSATLTLSIDSLPSIQLDDLYQLTTSRTSLVG